MGRAATAPDRAAAPVEEAQLDAVALGDVAQVTLAAVDLPLAAWSPASLLESEYPSITSCTSPRRLTTRR